jgi:hypothetical protein
MDAITLAGGLAATVVIILIARWSERRRQRALMRWRNAEIIADAERVRAGSGRHD